MYFMKGEHHVNLYLGNVIHALDGTLAACLPVLYVALKGHTAVVNLKLTTIKFAAKD